MYNMLRTPHRMSHIMCYIFEMYKQKPGTLCDADYIEISTLFPVDVKATYP